MERGHIRCGRSHVGSDFGLSLLHRDDRAMGKESTKAYAMRHGDGVPVENAVEVEERIKR